MYQHQTHRLTYPHFLVKLRTSFFAPGRLGPFNYKTNRDDYSVSELYMDISVCSLAMLIGTFFENWKTVR
jgi:hypothetical protein